MITNADIVKLQKVFATKKELETTTLDLVKFIGEVREELKHDILTFKDQVLHEINKVRDDFAVLTGYRDIIEDHEVRINKLEVKN